jgi:putative SOS response-associated peptidase YedK
MCGRYTLTYGDLSLVAAELEALVDPAAAELYRPRYNVAPTHAVVVGRAGADRPLLVPAVWGLHRDQRLIINVRSENAASRFARAYEHGRCVVPADGFYEWTGEQGDRRPVWFHLPAGAPLFMAGILDDRPGEPAPSFAVLTAPARPPIAAVHDRMPVLLSAQGARRWILERPPRVIVPDDLPLEARPVSPRANTTAHDDPACIEPAVQGPRQLGLF